MITNAINAVKEFNKAFKIEYSETQEANLDDSIIELRYRLMQEENNEYLEAARRKDLVEIADALGDKLYILCGTILAHGLQDKIVEVFNEIQKSNMSKLSIDGKPVIREDGKILKGPKLTKISPKKTYTGVIGGFLLSMIAGLVYIKYFQESKHLLVLQHLRSSHLLLILTR